MARASLTESHVPVMPTIEGEAAGHVHGRGIRNNHVTIPEDGHQWKKYGQKFIKKAKMVRCYFKCRRPRCKARKRVEWPPSDPSNLRVVYEGQHEHPTSHNGRTSQEQEPMASTTIANQYDLATQVFEGLTGDAS